jgi:hypothetical protein
MKSTKTISFFIIISVIVFGCAKENIQPKLPDNLGGRTIRYTVTVVSGDNFSKSEKSLVSASVSLIMNDSLYTKNTDSAGMATFNNLAAGNIVVKVTKTDFTTAVFTADLTLSNDSVSNYDTQNLRNASTIVSIFPTSGNGTAQIQGKAFADLDLTIPGFEDAPQGTVISAVIFPKNISNFINHNGGGRILNLYYENGSVSGTIQNNGDFSLTVPASSVGLDVILRAEDFIFNQKLNSSVSQRKIFSLTSDTLTVYSNLIKLRDIYFY